MPPCTQKKPMTTSDRTPRLRRTVLPSVPAEDDDDGKSSAAASDIRIRSGSGTRVARTMTWQSRGQREEDARSALRLNQLSIDARRKAASQRDQNAVVSVRCRLDDVGYDRAIASLQMGIYEKALAAFHERMASVGDEYNGGGGAPDVGDDHGRFSAADYTPGAGPTPRTAHRGGGGMMSPTSSSGLNMRGEYGAW